MVRHRCKYIKENGQQCSNSVKTGFGDYCWITKHNQSPQAKEENRKDAARVREAMNRAEQEEFLW